MADSARHPGEGHPREGPPGEGDPWEAVSAWWQAEFTDGADAEYTEQIMPLAAAHLAGCTRVLDVGCGEGQIGRLAALGGVERVVGVDPTVAQLVAASARGGGVALAQGEAARLPFLTASFDAAVACLVFEHIEAVDAAIAEVGRVLAPGGRFLFFLNHPLLQTPGSGWVDDTILEEQYWRIGPYLVEDSSLEEVDHGVVIPFIHRPLSRYVNAMIKAGLVLTRMEEPAPPPGFLARAAEYAAAATIPRLLFLRAEKSPYHPEAPLLARSAPTSPRRRQNGEVAEFSIITGLSGAGRSQAGATLEDLGWFVIDNMPTALVTKVAELV
ncbi:MAG: RNase adapter RapZ, partial [Acidimicrobiales bacterium]